MKKIMTDYKIEINEYSEKYRDKIKNVIGKILADISVIDQRSLPIDDEDLNKIDKIYSGKGRFWVAIKDGHVIGTVAIKDLGDKIARLKRMFVLIDYHGSGVGQKLLNHATNFAKNQGFIKIILNTHKVMKRAHKFYEKNNFIRKDKKGDKFYRYEKEL
ncbi:MAG: GNAT family N-acetyltransferase [Patescibacteria group bacterium]